MTDTTELFECEYDLEAAPEKVWRALTVPELVAEWLLPASADAGQGDHGKLDGKSAGLSDAIDCTVLDTDEPHRLRLRWNETLPGQKLESIVTFELERNGEGGTLLRLRHTRLAAMPMPANSNGPVMMALAA